jgi:hypothetical protein
MNKVYLVVIVRECSTDVWGVYASAKVAEANVIALQDALHNGSMRFDFCHIVERPFYQ